MYSETMSLSIEWMIAWQEHANFLNWVLDIRHVMLRRDKSCKVYRAIVTDIYKIEKEGKKLLGKVHANCQPLGLHEASGKNWDF